MSDMKSEIKEKVDRLLEPIIPFVSDPVMMRQCLLNGITLGIELVCEHFSGKEVNNLGMLQFIRSYQKWAREVQTEFTEERKSRQSAGDN